MTKHPEVKTMRSPSARTIVFSLLTSVFCFFAPACAFAQSALPQINSVQWDPIALGATQCAMGSGFGPVQGTVTINGAAAGVASWADTQVCAYLPNSVGTGSGSIQISNAAGASNAVSFAVVAAPAVSGVQPRTTGAGSQVTVTGTNFGSTGSVLLYGGSSGPVALGIVSWSGTQIVATVPSGLQPGTYGLQVSADGTTNNFGAIVVVAAGTISSVQWDPIALGATQCAMGSGFGPTQGTVTINGVAAAVASWADTQVCAYLPNSVGTGLGSIQISNAAGASNAVSFAVIGDPAVSGVQPRTTGAGSQVTVTGTNFGSTGSVLLYGGSSGPVALGIVSWSGTQIVATVPSRLQPGTYNLQVSADGTTANGGPLFVVATMSPVISALTPASGTVGTQVTITGSGFGATHGISTVSFNGVTASVTNWSDTSISVSVPSGATTGSVVVTLAGVSSKPVNFVVTGYLSTGSLNEARDSHTATLLTDGRVLIVGGQDSFGFALASAELFNSTSGIFTNTGSLNTARKFHTATLLDNGTVLVTGGIDDRFNTSSSAELYNPVTGTFTATSNLGKPRFPHTATVLNNGMALIVGGSSPGVAALASAELYDPVHGTFTATGNPNVARASHTATLLDNGMVLIAGGFDNNAKDLTSAELYDPSTGTFATRGSLNTGRNTHTAALLNNGQVLIAGGFDNNSTPLPM